jgi:hypothetical protein
MAVDHSLSRLSEVADLGEANVIIKHLREELAAICVALGRSKDGTGYDVDWFDLHGDVARLARSERKRCSVSFEHQPHDQCDGNPGANPLRNDKPREEDPFFREFDCHYDGDINRCDKNCKQLGVCKRRTSGPIAPSHAAPVGEQSFTVDSVRAASYIYEDCRARGQSAEEAMRRSAGRLVQIRGGEESADDACRRLGWWRQEKCDPGPFNVKGWYPSDAMRAFFDGFEAGQASITPSATPRGSGLYVASRVKQAEVWKAYRARGWKINASWIDEAGEGETADFGELWDRIRGEIARSYALVFYAAGVDDFPVKGALVEVGMALAMGKPVIAALENVMLDGRTMRPVGSWLLDRNVVRCDTLEEAMDIARGGDRLRAAMSSATESRNG